MNAKKVSYYRGLNKHSWHILGQSRAKDLAERNTVQNQMVQQTERAFVQTFNILSEDAFQDGLSRWTQPAGPSDGNLQSDDAIRYFRARKEQLSLKAMEIMARIKIMFTLIRLVLAVSTGLLWILRSYRTTSKDV